MTDQCTCYYHAPELHLLGCPCKWDGKLRPVTDQPKPVATEVDLESAEYAVTHLHPGGNARCCAEAQATLRALISEVRALRGQKAEAIRKASYVSYLHHHPIGADFDMGNAISGLLLALGVEDV